MASHFGCYNVTYNTTLGNRLNFYPLLESGCCLPFHAVIDFITVTQKKEKKSKQIWFLTSKRGKRGKRRLVIETHVQEFFFG